MVLNQDGIFSRAEKATDKYGQSKARETLELALGEAQMQKYEQGLTDLQLDNKINEIGELLQKEKPDPNLQNVIVDGHIFEVDRSVPKIVDYIGPADGVVITAVVSGNGGWFKEGDTVNVTITGRIKTYSGGTITSVSATKGGTAITDFSIDGEGKYNIDNITADTTIIINATDSNNKENSRTIPVTIRIDKIAPILSEVTATAEARRIKIKAIATDNESGLKHINYSVEPTTIKDGKATGTLSTGQEIILTATTSEEYTITFTAEDIAGNKSAEQSKTVETLGVIKHIETTEGLKEVNTVDIYGAMVTGYTCDRKKVDGTELDWQIFYIDEEDNYRVYLISKDYMAPPTTGTEMSKGSSSHAYYWNNTVLSKYKTTIPNTRFTKKFLNDYAGYNASSQENLQKTNYMLDQAMWSEYSNDLISEFAFGGPTVPLFQASYNDVSKKETQLSIKKDTYGYSFKTPSYSWNSGVNKLGDETTQRGIYFRDNPSIAYGYWVASPTNDDSVDSARTSLDGRIGSSSDNMYLWGFRPIISLQTDVKFIANTDGSYTIPK